MYNIGVIGLGYVGLTTAVSFSEIGQNIIGYDVDSSKIDMLRKGKIPIYEPNLEEYFQNNLKSGRLRFADNVEELVNSSDVIFICVGTPLIEETGELSMIYVEQVATSFVG